MRRSPETSWFACPALLLALALIVPGAGAVATAWSQTGKPKPGAAKKQEPPAPQVRYGTEGLPRPVIELREAMLGAIESGEIEELRHAYDLNEHKPDLGAAP